MDRQRRANNPDYYNQNGTAKKGKKKWNNSKRYKKTAAKKREIERKQTAHRKSLHGKLVNLLIGVRESEGESLNETCTTESEPPSL